MQQQVWMLVAAPSVVETGQDSAGSAVPETRRGRAVEAVVATVVVATVAVEGAAGRRRRRRQGEIATGMEAGSFSQGTSRFAKLKDE